MTLGTLELISLTTRLCGPAVGVKKPTTRQRKDLTGAGALGG